MHGRTFAALGAGATAGAATVALITTGVVGASLSILVAPPFSSPAAAEELQPFDDCEQLRQWYVDAALPMVGPWGLGWPGYMENGGELVGATRSDGAVDDVAGSTTPDAAVGNGDTGTNVQEAGVDEPDIAKTNGDIVVHLEGREVVLTDVSGDDPHELSRVTLPKRLNQAELLLVGDTVIVFGTESYYYGGPVYDTPMPETDLRGIMPPNGGSESATQLLTIDISEPAAPRIEQKDRIGGSLVSAREYDGTVRVVLSTGLPALDFVYPNRDRTEQEARRENREIVRNTGIESWLPSVRSGSSDEATPLLRCTDVQHPREQSGFGTISVLTFDADSPTDRSSTAVTAGGELVYSSMDRLYVATATGGWGDPVPLADQAMPTKPAPATTEVHAFAIDGESTEYVASGEVPGMVMNRWSFSEYDGHLRVATALGRDSWNPTENAVVVLEERGDNLVEVGRAGEMGIGEQIKSVRWFGDIAVVVTFLQVDPLYTIDLSDPTSPKVLGKLKIPGFSSYLHPIGDDLLLGLGQDATMSGSTTGAQAAVFDIGDLTDPQRVDTSGFDSNTELGVTWDTRAFTYLPEQRTAITPLQNYQWGGTRLAIIKVGKDGTLTQRLSHQVADWDGGSVRALPLEDGRVAIVAGNDVELMSIG